MVVRDVALLRTFVWVRPTNETWNEGDHPSQYPLDFMVAGDDFVPELENLGVPFEAATLSTSALGPRHEWTFEAADARATLAFVTHGDGEATWPRTSYLWFEAGDGHRRVTVEKTYGYDDLVRQVGTLRLEGQTRAGSGIPAWDGQRMAEAHEVWTLDERTF